MATDHVQFKVALPIHFFKIILETNVERIKMPSKFTLRYGGDLLNPVFLRTPDFTVWEVNWTKEKGEIWFEKGWKDFVENYSLHPGHFVLFQYGGTSQIDVLILDQSALEINYLSSDCGEEICTLDQSNGESVMAAKVEHNARPNLPFVSSRTRSHKKLRTGSNQNVESKSKPQKMDFDVGVPSDEGIKFQKNVEHQSKDLIASMRGRSLNIPKLLRAQKVAKEFESENHFFTLVIKQSHLEQNAVKQVPKFLGIVSKEKNVNNVTLRIGARWWDVKLSVCAPTSNYDRLTSGWSLFVKEANLQVGDICIFELVDPDLMFFEIHITNCSST